MNASTGDNNDGHNSPVHRSELSREKFFPYEYFQKRNTDIPGDNFASDYRQKCNKDEDNPMQYVYMRINHHYNEAYEVNPADHIITSKVPLISEILGVLLRIDVSRPAGQRSIIRICRDYRFDTYVKRKSDCYKTFDNGLKHFEALKSSIYNVLTSPSFLSAGSVALQQKKLIVCNPDVSKSLRAFEEYLRNEVKMDLIEIMDFYIHNAEQSLLLLRTFIDEEKASGYDLSHYITSMIEYIKWLYSADFDKEVKGKITGHFQKHLKTLVVQILLTQTVMDKLLSGEAGATPISASDKVVVQMHWINGDELSASLKDNQAVKKLKALYLLIQELLIQESELVPALRDNELIEQTNIHWGEFIGKQIILSMDVLTRLLKYSCDAEEGVTTHQLQKILGFDLKQSDPNTSTLSVFEFKYFRNYSDENDYVEHICLPSRVRSFFERVNPRLLEQLETKIKFRFIILISLFMLPRPSAAHSRDHQIMDDNTSWDHLAEAFHNRIEKFDSAIKFIWLMTLYFIQNNGFNEGDQVSLMILSVVCNRSYKDLVNYRNANDYNLPDDLVERVSEKDVFTEFFKPVFKEFKDLCGQESIFGEKEFVFLSDNSDTFYPILAQRLVSSFLHNAKQVPDDALKFRVSNCSFTLSKSVYTNVDVLRYILDITGITINNNRHIIYHEHAPNEHELHDVGEILDLLQELFELSINVFSEIPLFSSNICSIYIPQYDKQLVYSIVHEKRAMFYRLLTHLICDDKTIVMNIFKVADRLYRKQRSVSAESTTTVDYFRDMVLCSIKIDIQNVQAMNSLDTAAVDMHLAVLEFIAIMFRASANGFMELPTEHNRIVQFNLMAEFFDLSKLEEWICALTEQLYVCTLTLNDRIKVKVLTKIFELLCELSSSSYCLQPSKVPLASFIMSKLFLHHSEYYLPQFLVALKDATYVDVNNAKQKRVITDSKLMLSSVQMFSSFVHYIKQDSHLMNNPLMDYLTSGSVSLSAFCTQYDIKQQESLVKLLNLSSADTVITYGKVLSAVEAHCGEKNKSYLSQDVLDDLTKLEMLVKENFNGIIGFDFIVQFGKQLIDCTVYILLEANQAKYAFHDNWNIMAACLLVLDSVASVPSSAYSGSSLYISSVLEDYLMSLIAANDQLMHLICTMSVWPTVKALVKTNEWVEDRRWFDRMVEVVDHNQQYKPKPSYINILPVTHNQGLWYGSADNDIDEHTIPFVNQVIEHSLNILITIFQKVVAPVYSREVVTQLQNNVDVASKISAARSALSNTLYQVLVTPTHGTIYDPFNSGAQVFPFDNIANKLVNFNYIIGLCGMIHISYKGIWVDEINTIQLKVITLLTNFILFMGCNSSCVGSFDDVIGVLNIAGFVDSLILNFKNPEAFRSYKYALVVDRALDLLLVIGTVQPKVLSLLFSVKAKPKDVYRYRTDVEQHLNLHGTRAEDSELLLTCFSFGRTQKSFSEPLDVEYEIKIILLLLLVWKKSGQHKMLFSVFKHVIQKSDFWSHVSLCIDRVKSYYVDNKKKLDWDELAPVTFSETIFTSSFSHSLRHSHCNGNENILDIEDAVENFMDKMRDGVLEASKHCLRLRHLGVCLEAITMESFVDKYFAEQEFPGKIELMKLIKEIKNSKVNMLGKRKSGDHVANEKFEFNSFMKVGMWEGNVSYDIQELEKKAAELGFDIGLFILNDRRFSAAISRSTQSVTRVFVAHGAIENSYTSWINTIEDVLKPFLLAEIKKSYRLYNDASRAVKWKEFAQLLFKVCSVINVTDAQLQLVKSSCIYIEHILPKISIDIRTGAQRRESKNASTRASGQSTASHGGTPTNKSRSSTASGEALSPSPQNKSRTSTFDGGSRSGSMTMASSTVEVLVDKLLDEMDGIVDNYQRQNVTSQLAEKLVLQIQQLLLLLFYQLYQEFHLNSTLDSCEKGSDEYFQRLDLLKSLHPELKEMDHNLSETTMNIHSIIHRVKGKIPDYISKLCSYLKKLEDGMLLVGLQSSMYVVERSSCKTRRNLDYKYAMEPLEVIELLLDKVRNKVLLTILLLIRLLIPHQDILPTLQDDSMEENEILKVYHVALQSFCCSSRYLLISDGFHGGSGSNYMFGGTVMDLNDVKDNVKICLQLMNSTMEFHCCGVLDNKELYELLPVLSHHAAKVVPLLHRYDTWNDIESAINVGNDGEPFFPENTTVTLLPDELKTSEVALSSTISLLDVLFHAVRNGNLSNKVLVSQHGSNVLALLTASPVLLQYRNTLCASTRSRRFMAAFMGYNGLSIDDSVVCDIFLRTVDIFTAVIKASSSTTDADSILTNASIYEALIAFINTHQELLLLPFYFENTRYSLRQIRCMQTIVVFFNQCNWYFRAWKAGLPTIFASLQQHIMSTVPRLSAILYYKKDDQDNDVDSFMAHTILVTQKEMSGFGGITRKRQAKPDKSHKHKGGRAASPKGGAAVVSVPPSPKQSVSPSIKGGVASHYISSQNPTPNEQQPVRYSYLETAMCETLLHLLLFISSVAPKRPERETEVEVGMTVYIRPALDHWHSNYTKVIVTCVVDESKCEVLLRDGRRIDLNTKTDIAYPAVLVRDPHNCANNLYAPVPFLEYRMSGVDSECHHSDVRAVYPKHDVSHKLKQGAGVFPAAGLGDCCTGHFFILLNYIRNSLNSSVESVNSTLFNAQVDLAIIALDIYLDSMMSYASIIQKELVELRKARKENRKKLRNRHAEMHDLDRFHLKNVFAELKMFEEFIKPRDGRGDAAQQPALIKDLFRFRDYRPSYERDFNHIKHVVMHACEECGIHAPEYLPELLLTE